MEPNTSSRRNLASLHPKPSIDPTEKKKYPIYHPSTSTIPAHTTIQSISNNFSKLYTNHIILSSLTTTDKLIQPHPQPLPISSNLDSSCTTLTKSKIQHVRRNSVTTVPQQHNTKTNIVKERILVKDRTFRKVKQENETTHKEWKTKESVEEIIKTEDVKNAHSLMSRSCNEGRRKSFCSSNTKLANFFLCSGVKVVAVDMPPYMQIHTVNCARKTRDSLEKFTARTLACTQKGV